MPGEGVYLLGERTDGVLGGEVGLAVAPFLDGEHTVDQIVDRLEGVIDLPSIYYAIELGRRSGFVVSEPPLPDSTAEVFWGSIGAAAAARRWSRQPPRFHLSVLAGEDAAASRRAFQELGWEEAVDGVEVVLVDDYLAPALAEINLARLRSRAAWLPAKLAGTMVWLGPLIDPGRTACWACMAQRISANREVASYVSWRHPGHRAPKIPAPMLSLTREIAARMLALMVARVDAGILGAGDRLLTFDFMTFQIEEHHVIRRPQCAACGDPALAQDQSPVVLQTQPLVPNADGYRSTAAETTYHRFVRHVSPIVGAVTELQRLSDDSDPTMHTYFAGHNFAVRSRNLRYLKEGLRSKSSGKGSTDSQARASAIGEALERYSGIFQGDEPRVTARYSSLDDALHPNLCMLFSDKQYAEQDRWLARESRFAVVPLPFDEDDEVEWTKVWSMTGSCWRQLPTGYLYYGYPHQADQFYYWADSNGNAAGNTLEEAILQGFLELVERDSVCLWWYNRLRRPAFDLASFADPWIDAVVARYDMLRRPVWVLDVTSDLGIPSFVALSARIDTPIEDILVACGAHLDPQIAVHRALGELNQFLPAVLPRHGDGSGEYAFPDPDCQEWWRSATRENQPYLVPDHAVPPRRRDDFPVVANADLRSSVEYCQRLVEGKGLEMLVHNQTRPDIGLPVAKVIVPGLRHFWARFGPGRLYDVPVAHGWLGEPTDEANLNPIPLFL